jgi:energy-coupling factor transporter transmembrane protein EcfT
MIIPIGISHALQRFWGFMLFKYSFLACLCLSTIYAQMLYRVPGRFFFFALPVIGLVLIAMLMISIMTPFLKGLPADDPFLRMLRNIERTGVSLIFLFACYGVVIFANGFRDQSPPRAQISTVGDMNRDDFGVAEMVFTLSWIELAPGEPSNAGGRLMVHANERAVLWRGQPVVLEMRQGAVGIPWVSKVSRDEERYWKDVLEHMPTATEAWKRLARLYLARQRFNDAYATARRYLEIAPHDFDFACNIASGFAVSHRFAEAAAILEPYAKEPDYERYNTLGWIFHKLGKNERAVELLKVSIPLDPDNFYAYFHLGYTLKDMGRNEEAIAMFEKVLQYRPIFPEMDEQIRLLRKKIDSTKAKSRP